MKDAASELSWDTVKLLELSTLAMMALGSSAVAMTGTSNYGTLRQVSFLSSFP